MAHIPFQAVIAGTLTAPLLLGLAAAPAAATAPSQTAASVAAAGPDSRTADRRAASPSRARAPFRFGTTKYNQWYATQYMKFRYGWHKNKQRRALILLWNRESGWSQHAHNGSSGAHGIPQSLPGSKMASQGGDWRRNPETQIKWGLSYIKGRYGSPAAAWRHSQHVGWY